MTQYRLTPNLTESPPVRTSHRRFRIGILALSLLTPFTSIAAGNDTGKPPMGIKRLARELREIPDTKYFALRKPLYSPPPGLSRSGMQFRSGAGSRHAASPVKGIDAVNRNLVTVHGYEGIDFAAVDIPAGCTARVNGAKVYPESQQIVLIMQAKLVSIHPDTVRLVRRWDSPEAEQWAADILRRDKIRLICGPGVGGRAEVVKKAGNRIRQDSVITFFFEDVEEGQLARGFCTMWVRIR